MPLETELKLEISPRHLAQLAAHPLFKPAQRVRRRLHSVYFDTPELDLWRAGVTLRLRRTGRRWTQTVKYSGRVTAGLHEREEFEALVSTPIPDFNAIEGSVVAKNFSSRELRARLQPLIVTEFTRVSRLLTPADGVAIEASVDRGLITCAEATLPLCELELEVKEGPAWHAHQLAMQLLETVPLLVEDRSKAQRGIALYLKTPQKPVKTQPTAVVAEMTANDAFKALIAGCLAHFADNQRGMLADGDPEYLHQMRVALRRLRSVFSTFAPLLPPAKTAHPIAQTRWLARMLGPARDWDVFATETLPPVMARYPQHAGLATLARAAEGQRSAANRRARNAVASARGQGVLLTLGAWTSAETWLETLDNAHRQELGRPAIEYARKILGAAAKRVRKRGRDFAELAPAELHRLRIAAKKLRYATEFFAQLFDEKTARDYRAVLARLQDALGAYNDAVKTTEFAERAGRRQKGAPADEARGIMLGWSAGVQHAGARALTRVWKEFRNAAPFWK
jgi:triphosphatase